MLTPGRGCRGRESQGFLGLTIGCLVCPQLCIKGLTCPSPFVFTPPDLWFLPPSVSSPLLKVSGDRFLGRGLRRTLEGLASVSKHDRFNGLLLFCEYCDGAISYFLELANDWCFSSAILFCTLLTYWGKEDSWNRFAFPLLLATIPPFLSIVWFVGARR